MSAVLDPLLERSLARRDANGLRRRTVTVEASRPGDPPGHLRQGGTRLLDLCGNDYLGLARHPALAARAADWARTYGTGAAASRLVSGTLAIHEAVETRLARLKGRPSALLFASGWQANASVIPALAELLAQPVVFADRLIHASLHHGIRAAGLRQIRFRHNDLDHLRALLAARAGGTGTPLIVTETVFSMDGDRADLAGLRALAAEFGAVLYLDEAHATGVLGPGGAGLAATGPAAPDEIVMGTCSKALGGFGAYVAGSALLREALLNHASGVIHTTALPPPVLGALDAALELLPGLDDARARVADTASRLRQALHGEGLDTGASSTQIVPVRIGDTDAALALAAQLHARGVLAVAIRPPTVPPGTARLRLSVSAVHDPEAVLRVPLMLAQARVGS